MKRIFKMTVAFLITMQIVQAQNLSTIEMDEIRTVFNKSFKTNEGTTFVMDLEDTSVVFQTSNDGKLHINYTMEFNNYRKKDIEKLVNRHHLTANKEGDKITFTSKIELPKNHTQYEWEEVFIKSKIARNKKKKEDLDVIKKSKDSFLSEINESDWSKIRRLRGDFKVKPHVKKWKNSTKLHISKMVVKIPPFVNIRANFKSCNATFSDNLINMTIINSKNSKIKFEEINNDFNEFIIDGGTFSATKLNNGIYKLLNIISVKIGEIDNASIESEFSKIEIGEVLKEAFIDDFNSEYFIYNWSKKFENLQVESRYSKLNFFLPKNGYKFSLMGENNKVFEKLDVMKEIENDKYEPQWYYNDSSLYGNIGGSFSNSIIYFHKEQ